MANNLSLDVINQLGMRIAYLRKEKGISQLDLAIDSGVSKSYLSDLEHGRRNPSVVTLNRIAMALDVTLETLFKGVVDVNVL